MELSQPKNKEDWSHWVEQFKRNSPKIKVDLENIGDLGYLPNAGKPILVLRNVLSKQECDDLISMTEELGYRVMQEYNKTYRSNTRVMSEQPELADAIFARVKHLLPDTFNRTWVINGLNERFRFCRYTKGQHFNPHCDGIYRRTPNERSYLTFMIYLNDEFTGGHTRFLNSSEGILYSLKAEPGLVLCFQHDIFHDGERLEGGKKYIMRSDVLYKK